MTKKQFNDFIDKFDFIHLFNHLGWDISNQVTPIKINSENFSVQSVAGKSGFRILVCPPDSLGNIPAYPLRLKIDNAVSKLFKEHLLIFVNGQKTQQVWQTYVKHAHQPLKLSSVSWYKGQTPELLYQKAAGLIFTLDEEENITIVDVVARVTANFSQNNERVTKQFYEKFKKEHTSFIDFIKGIDDQLNRDWYASLMLNRLMFCYFIQKKGFLDNNQHYLREKLAHCQEKKGANQFYSFYRDFLLQLFHNGLGSPDHSNYLLSEIGNIPYLNGGLFDEHELEVNYNEIDIDDKAFERIFNFFDDWNWHLDTRAAATGRDINPDVIGYIFEKYINDRADMGAYYTKEDITEYISKNCILPYLFDETRRQYPNDSGIWNMVKTSGDTYIYDAVKKGITTPLPEKISTGITNVAARTEWNKPAPDEFALPTEIWREVVERRNRYTEVKYKIKNGEITQINDFITYNLDIRQFAQDVIQNTTDADYLRHFYKVLNNVTILDPTCGSGAFLFAAMNILEPLYESCLARMRSFTDDEDRLNKEDKSIFANKYKYFREVLQETQNDQHPNLQYYIYKSIILRNLYGVDIMKEAVEIAKLRLFLKLVATVDVDNKKPNMGLEPLPDIDFNIRSGNTLIGFGTEGELKKGLEYTFDGVIVKPIIEEKCDIVSKAFARYKEIQLSYGEDFKAFKKAKEDLLNRLKDLNHELNILLHKQVSSIDYNVWLKNYQPFHWFAEFYGIIQVNKGFDVIIGNPPYVEYSKVRNTYKINGYETERCGNLYVFVIERTENILNQNGLIGMIIPISAFSNSSMETFQKLFKRFPLSYVSNFHQRPAALFEGVLQRLSIFISYKRTKSPEIYTTNVYRWKSETRNILFSSLYFTTTNQTFQKQILKVGSAIETSILNKYLKHKEVSTYLSPIKELDNRIFYRTAGGGYWVTILNTNFDTTSLSNKAASFQQSFNSKVFSAVINSNLFWWYYSINFDQFNFKDYMIFGFRFTYPVDEVMVYKLTQLSEKLERELLSNATTYTINSKTRGSNETITYNKYFSKYTMNNIDNLIAKCYGFTDEELDFIINYDIKYRMGKELESEEV